MDFKSSNFDNNYPDFLKRTDLSKSTIQKTIGLSDDDQALFDRAANEIKYQGYIAKQLREVASAQKHEETTIPKNTNYTLMKGLSNEVVERLTKSQPSTLGQAGRLEGVTPAAINLISINIKNQKCSYISSFRHCCFYFCNGFAFDFGYSKTLRTYY